MAYIEKEEAIITEFCTRVRMQSWNQETIEVYLGDEEDPATYWMLLKADLARINEIGKVCDWMMNIFESRLFRAMSNAMKNFVSDFVRYWFPWKNCYTRRHQSQSTKTFCRQRPKEWSLVQSKVRRSIHETVSEILLDFFSFRILEILAIDGRYELEAFLVDYGQNLHGIQYPRGVSYLIDDLDKLDPIAFKFSLNGEMRIKWFCRTYKSTLVFFLCRSYSNQEDVQIRTWYEPKASGS